MVESESFLLLLWERLLNAIVSALLLDKNDVVVMIWYRITTFPAVRPGC